MTNIVSICHMVFWSLPKTLTLWVHLCQILLQTWYWTIFIPYNLMKICWKNQHRLKQQNYVYYFYMDNKLHKTIFRIIYLGSHKFLQTEHPHRSFHFLYNGFLFHVLKVTPSLSINFYHKVSNFHFPQVFSTSSTRIKHDIREEFIP